MDPAFSTARGAAAFGALVAILLAAPAVVAELDVLDRSEVYPTLPTYAGPISHIHRQIFEEDGELDVVFVGSSLMWSAIDAPYVQETLSTHLGRPASVTVMASVWPGLDRDYAFLRDLLDRRRVGMVVLQFPNRERPTIDPAVDINRPADEPHVQAFRLFRAGEFPELSLALPPRYRASLYAGAVLGLPRHVLTLIRTDRLALSGYEETLGARFQTTGYYGAPFEVFRPEPPRIDPAELIYSEGSPSYQFFDEPFPSYQLHFARLIGALLAEHDLPAVLLHVPQANEIDATTVEERMHWLEATGIEASMVGVPPTRLFEGFSVGDTHRFFASDHLNENGAIYFTRVVTPALLRVFDESATSP